MSASRMSALSASTRQWVMDTYLQLLAQHPGEYQRRRAIFDSLIEGAGNGELNALEYLRALTAPGLAALEKEMAERCIKLGEATLADAVDTAIATTATISEGTGSSDIISCSGPPLPTQRALFPIDVIDAKIRDVKERLARINAEHRRLLEQEHDSREVRKMLRAEKKLLQDELADLTAAKNRTKAAPETGKDELTKLGLDPYAVEADENLEVML
ncbi:hypothetical protein ACWC5C_38605 [Streptomyces sp. NPDC001700]